MDSNAQNFQTPSEKDTNHTTTYIECIEFYKKLAQHFDEIKIISAGASDIGDPIYTVIISENLDFTPEQIRLNNKTILFINNGIHPGEPEGIDASMILARELLTDPSKKSYLKNVSIIITPIYNVGGSQNRNSFSRVNQEGPEAYGFRGNAQNLDLNRDFIKCDSRNAITFNQLFNYWKPDIFVDTHTSNGADYPYTMTLIATQKNKLEKSLADLLQLSLLPYLYHGMKEAQDEMVPYVDIADIPDHGIYDFMDYARYSTGYAALHHCIGFMPETHMWKPFQQRLESTLRLLNLFVEFSAKNRNEIITAKQKSVETAQKMENFVLAWQLDKNQFDTLHFATYKAEFPISAITGLKRLKYNREIIEEKVIPYFNHFVPQLLIQKPKQYILPKAYEAVAERLRWNGVHMHSLKNDTTITAVFYKILSYESPKTPYENHFLHSKIILERKIMERTYFTGDWIIPTDQEAIQYIIHTLEPQAPDSFFAWNFFDGILQRKEYFSDYMFEDMAIQILHENPELKNKFEEKKKSDNKFVENAAAQLHYIYEHSKYSESGYMIYPVARIE
ncbi:MAG: hypothetical protein M3Q56_03285 [Bacteroidota bacterium]|nr:hypothetical protein [Bacteroidota bacterium]